MSETTTTNTNGERQRRHRVETLLGTLGQARENETRQDLRARLDAVIAILEAGMSQRKTVVLPDGAGLVEIEAHLGLPDADGDRSAWRRIRRDLDERKGADYPAGLYIMPAERANEPRPSRWTPDPTIDNSRDSGHTRR